MSLSVKPVRSERDFQRFLKLPYRIHRNESRWIPPVPQLRAQALDRSVDPYFEHAEAEFLLAERDGEEVGQVIAHVDRALNAHKENRWGLFGFFDSVDDQEVARALLDTAADWLAERDRDRILGPFSFSSKEEPGVLVEGFDLAPVIYQRWNPPYIGELLEGCGFSKAKDILWRDLEIARIPAEIRELLARWAELAKTRFGVSVRPLRQDDIEAELERVYRFIPPIFENHWGYVPPTEVEMLGGLDMVAGMLGPGTLIAEQNGELLASSMMIPDLNQRMAHEDGEVTRTDAVIDQGRLLFMAVTPACRHMGLTPALCHAHLEMAEADGLEHLVLGWSFEDNEEMNQGLARLGLEISRRHRVYQRMLA